jgi:ABC-type enterochelin transport system substrate-binding protein
VAVQIFVSLLFKFSIESKKTKKLVKLKIKYKNLKTLEKIKGEGKIEKSPKRVVVTKGALCSGRFHEPSSSSLV